MKKVFYLCLMLASIITNTGCLKDDPYTAYADGEPLITVPNSNWPVMQQQPDDSLFSASAAKDTLLLYVEFSWNKTKDGELKVTFQKDSSLIADFNSKWRTNYIELPADKYQAPNLTAIIPAHSRRASIPIVVFPNTMNISNNYMLAYTVVDAQGIVIASTYKSMLFPMKAQ
ncbi:hypothetical protein A3860_05205 [Niastella vici]|uniref:BT-3987-like N-terminal domain-containing protein n=1 Tax=Niastella vici TaxID=1703345 RepID=A0A1V9FS48_9BACT|nr:DUF1735 domain-containing protein [Niastella vici]OQP61117.1 hypothetical protein A3860_05205 [Niastella vici]